MTNNLIKTLLPSSFQQTHKLQYLYLKTNLIAEIHKNSFAHLHSLEFLDLSDNKMKFVPQEIFNLPKLKILAMTHNSLETFDFSIIKTPILAPLESLDLGYNAMQNIPKLGLLPHLKFLKLANNNFSNAKPSDFRSFCNLSRFDISYSFRNKCNWCQIERYLIRTRKVQMGGKPCIYDADKPINGKL